MIMAGAIPATLLALAIDRSLFLFEKLIRYKKPSGKKLTILAISIMVFILFAFQMTQHAKAGFTPEFIGRKDGFIGLQKKYQWKINNVVVSDAVMYSAIKEGELDIISGYSTDGRIKTYDLSILEDDKKNFPPYYAALTVRNKTLRKYPELYEVLKLLKNRISDKDMVDLNYEVDILHKNPESVAEEYLRKINLWKRPQSRSKGIIKIGSKIFSEQYILASMYQYLIEGYTALKVEKVTGLGGTKICFDALINSEIDMYPEYTGTALLVILSLPEKEAESIFEDREKVFQRVKKEYHDKYDVAWTDPLGFNNTYAIMVRKEYADRYHLGTISDLINLHRSDKH